MQTVVIGLGNIGGAIAGRLAASMPVVGVDLAANVRSAWSEQFHMPSVQTLQEVDWSQVQRVIVVVKSSAVSLSIVHDLAGLVTRETPVHVMTTLEHADALALGQLATNQLKVSEAEAAVPAAAVPAVENIPGSLRILEQPVSGGVSGAAAGTLTVMSAGNATLADIEFLQQNLAKEITEFEGLGQPTLVKLLNNAAAAFNLATNAWVLQTATRHGISAQTMQNVLDTSSGGSTISTFVGQMCQEQGELLDKDVQLLANALGGLPSMHASGAATADEHTVDEVNVDGATPAGQGANQTTLKTAATNLALMQNLLG